jgi:DNA polymerase-3 subunit delta'
MKFSDVIGQKGIKSQLIQTVKQNRISHAQLFLGPEGCGKLALALAYAQYINCRNRVDGDSCGSCASCVKYEKLAHPDLHLFYPVSATREIKDHPMSRDFVEQWRELLLEKHAYIGLHDWIDKIEIEKKQAIITKDDMEELIRLLTYKNYEADYKAVIIYLPEKIYYASAPKILKILEEPPDNTLFILVSEDQEEIIDTILSRCQLVKIPRVGDDDLRDHLLAVRGLTGQEAQGIITLAGGSMVDAARLLSRESDTPGNLDAFRNWARLCYTLNIKGLDDFIGKTFGGGREQNKAFLNYALRMARECILLNYGRKDLVRLDKDEEEWVTGFFYPFVNAENGGLIVGELNKAIAHVERNANASILFMDLSLRMHALLKKAPSQK